MSTSAMPVVGFIGLGLMGSPMSLHLLDAGYTLVVHDRRPEAAAPHLARGATWAATPRELARQCEVVFSCLPGLHAPRWRLLRDVHQLA